MMTAVRLGDGSMEYMDAREINAAIQKDVRVYTQHPIEAPLRLLGARTKGGEIQGLPMGTGKWISI